MVSALRRKVNTPPSRCAPHRCLDGDPDHLVVLVPTNQRSASGAQEELNNCPSVDHAKSTVVEEKSVKLEPMSEVSQRSVPGPVDLTDSRNPTGALLIASAHSRAGTA